MDFNYWLQLIISILSGLAVAIPLVIKLVNVVKTLMREKNWNLLMKMTMDFMVDAEKQYSSGAARKEWVLNMVISSAATINYTLTNDDLLKLNDMIDSICDASKIINNSAERNQALKDAQDKIKELESASK